MRIPIVTTAFVGLIATTGFLFAVSAADKPEDAQAIRNLRTSARQQDFYAKTEAASLLQSSIPAAKPLDGPGVVTNASAVDVVELSWFSSPFADKAVTCKRFIPWSSIVAIDDNSMLPGGMPEQAGFMYYKGPSGENEVAIVRVDKLNADQGHMLEKLLARWRQVVSIPHAAN